MGTSLFQVSIQESINRFRALNKRLEKDVAALGHEVDALKETSDRLGKSLAAFDDIRKEMDAYAKKSGVKIDEVFKQTQGIFDSMSQLQDKQEQTILMKAYTDLEFKDDTEGMTLKEWKRFCTRVP